MYSHTTVLKTKKGDESMNKQLLEIIVWLILSVISISSATVFFAVDQIENSCIIGISGVLCSIITISTIRSYRERNDGV